MCDTDNDDNDKKLDQKINRKYVKLRNTVIENYVKQLINRTEIKYKNILSIAKIYLDSGFYFYYYYSSHAYKK